jgi:dihydrolipoamide dehydrogenase
MVMGSLPEQVDLAVVGAGVGGYIAAIRGAELGLSVALVEKEKLGGHCLNYACIPSKTLIHIADIYWKAQNSEKFGISTESIHLDAKRMLEWRNGVSAKLENGVGFLCKANGVDVLKGAATFLNSHSLQLTDGVTLEFKKAIIATGSVPAPLKGFEFSETVIDYKKALQLDHIPKSMAIIGAGYVSVEIGMLYAKMGCAVSIVARSDVLSRFDQEAVALIKNKMDALGIRVYKGVSPKSHAEGRMELSDGTVIESELIVVAIGLLPYTSGLGLENTSVKLNDKGFVIVDERLMTSDPNIYAIGDVIGEPMLAHKAMRQGVVAAESASGANAAFDNIVVPAVIFSDPEVAIAGSMDEKEGITVSKFPLTALGRAIALDATDGFVKIAADSSGTIKGIEIVSEDANALISEAALAIEMGANLVDIANTIHPHPTYGEAVQEAAELALGRPVHIFSGRKPHQPNPV